MAAKILPEDDLHCSVCCDIFKEPVVLSCSHSFCQGCLQDYWKENLCKPCPLCRCKSLVEKPPINLALRNLCEAYCRSQGESSAPRQPLCKLHNEKLKLFCLDERYPVCVDCLTKEHKGHKFCSTEEAVHLHKEQLGKALKPLNARLEILTKSKEACVQTAKHCTSQCQVTEDLMKNEFRKLHQFLVDEEAHMIAELREEERKKTELLKMRTEEIEGMIKALSDTINLIEQEMKTDDLTFLMKYPIIAKMAEFTKEDPEHPSGVLIDVTKYMGNLNCNVWKKMLGLVQYSPVILDPNTAHPMLKLSSDLTSLVLSETQPLPDNPERFDTYLQVLGSEGFDSGKHFWEVEVAGSRSWLLGVVKESAKRKGVLSPLSPANGLWCIWFREGSYIAVTFPETQLLVRKKLKRVRVVLEWNRGEVSFTDPSDESLIYKFRHKLSEKVFPVFSTGAEIPLRLIPQKVSISL
ncbi:zinc-binding protein A33-like [Denticeps clupeoides]|uniref:Zinc-binding protein A33-like n=1 Tax=Denticeps clupeoides TaxID=299321 RepID=A0AAY4BP85_9TELE|nr:zinc-binding protein A33-like [Denticeps clupeoides]XP_028842205.1 zinc-binding protein A33-like [Denticeps clupeoides]